MIYILLIIIIVELSALLYSNKKHKEENLNKLFRPIKNIKFFNGNGNRDITELEN